MYRRDLQGNLLAAAEVVARPEPHSPCYAVADNANSIA